VPEILVMRRKELGKGSRVSKGSGGGDQLWDGDARLSLNLQVVWGQRASLKRDTGDTAGIPSRQCALPCHWELRSPS
jgi:hypothetical protein